MMDEIHTEAPLAEYAFSWGKKLRLYPDYLDVHGTHYPLGQLTHIRPTYRRVMGISSLRLELYFGEQKIILRGIAALGEAQKALAYLDSRLSGEVARAAPGAATTRGDEAAEERRLRAQAPTDKIATPNWQRFRQERRALRLKRLQTARALREYGFDVDELARQLSSEALPEIRVPLCLLPGERAHYSSDATLCAEHAGSALRSPYPPRDHGTLFLTSKRLVYIGRARQIVLDYARISYAAHLQGAIALQARHWHRREIFELRQSLACSMHLEAILKRLSREQECATITQDSGSDVQPRQAKAHPAAALASSTRRGDSA